LVKEQKYIVLNVDDDDISRYTITRILEKAGFKVEEAATGKEALEKVKEHPDIILLDINLHDIDGFEVCKRIKSDPDLSYIPILHISATYRDSDSVVKGLNGGADGSLVQPVEPLVLVAYIKALLRLKNAEKKALETARQWDETFNAISSAIFLIDREGKIVRCNRVALEMAEASEDKILNRFLKSVLVERGIPEENCPFDDMIEKKSMQTTVFYYNNRYFRIVLNPIPEENNRLKGGVCIVTDITEIKRLEEQFRQAQKMEAIGRLTGGIAHDFNNMLTAIIGYSDFLLMNLKEKDPSRQIIKEIKKAGKRAASLTQKLLAFSRKQVLQPEIIDLNDVVRDMEKMIRRLIGEDIELVTVLVEDLDRIKADRSQIEQVIMNLVVNARDAMPSGGRLTVETGNVEFDTDYTNRHLDTKIIPGSYVMLAISDTGIGMDEKTRSHIFEPFFTTKGKGEGTGLGLSTVYGIVKQSGGYIWVYSEPGMGTTFKIYFPKIEEKAAERRKTEKEEVISEGTENILLVEDEDMVRGMVRESLVKFGYNVLDARNPEEAIQIADRNDGTLDLLITDVIMPGMNGKSLAEYLVKKHPKMKVLYMSGYTDQTIVSQGILEEDISFIQKPFSPVDIAKKVREVLDQKK